MTPWHEHLLAHGARFNGMAVGAFGDPAGELAAARDTAVLCDLEPLGALRVHGPDAEAFLQGQVTSDVAALASGAAQYSAWCTPKGRVLANFLLRRIDGETFELLLPEPLRAPIRERLGMFVLRSKVTLGDTDASAVRMGLGGPAAGEVVKAAVGSLPSPLRSIAVEGGEMLQVLGARFVAIVAIKQAERLWDRIAQGARPAGFPCWKWLTVRAGVPVILPATQGQFIPQAINWDAIEGVSFQKGCYSGQEIVARTQYLGRLKERTVLGHTEQTGIDAGTRLFSTRFGDQPCGTVVNAADAPSGGTDFLAVAQLSATADTDLRLGAISGPSATLLPVPYELRAPTPRGRGV